MKRKLSNDRAMRVLASARQEFSTWGYAGGRVDRIVAAAGVNKQLLFYYYQSKRGLFHAVLHQAAVELERSLAGGTPRGGSPLERLRAALATQFDYLARHPDLVSLLTHGTRVEAAVFAPAIKRLVVLLAEGQGLGQVRGDVDPHIAAAQATVGARTPFFGNFLSACRFSLAKVLFMKIDIFTMQPSQGLLYYPWGL